ncbi:MAG: ATP phosphoribosyltransferase regulatory subunit [Thermoleophilia bacterium]
MSDLPPAALPAGAKDVLAVEAHELRAVEGALGERFRRFGYREVMTPVLEFEEVVDRAGEGRDGAAFRLFDDHGRVLVLRPDLTIPVARLVATRMADHPGPVRVSYVARVFRPVPVGRPRSSEQRQAGVELVGADGPGADAEILALLVESLRAAGLAELRVGIADVSLTAAVLDGAGVAAGARGALIAALAGRDLVEWRRLAREAAPAGAAGDLLARLPSLHGGAGLLDEVAAAIPAAADACARLRSTLDLAAARGAGGALMLDLSVLRPWSYYSGIVFEASAPGVGEPIAMGGRYDGLGARFGRSRPAVGLAITLDLLHRALRAGDGPAGAPRDGIVLAGGLDGEAEAAGAARAAGLAVIAVGEGEGEAERVAEADGWRWVARRAGDGFDVTDRAAGTTARLAALEEVAR